MYLILDALLDGVGDGEGMWYSLLGDIGSFATDYDELRYPVYYYKADVVYLSG